jgi:hypothetical protein
VPWNVPAVPNVLETLAVFPETEPPHVYWYGEVPPETEAVKVLLCPVEMVLGEAEHVTASGIGVGRLKLSVYVT